MFWLSIAPVIAIIHLAVGHAILHHINPDSPSWPSRLASTAYAGAIGGTIFGVFLVPLFMSVFTEALQRFQQAQHGRHQDRSIHSADPLNSLIGRTQLAACMAIVLAGAPAAGALGVVCLRVSGSTSRALSPGEAAVAGVVGGAAVWGCVFSFLASVIAAMAVYSNFGAYKVRRGNAIFLA
ncbi:hypothetical protein H0H81_011441 [Sphagnurus paluster]|uniref:Uncharacterized protein n=1 Tax=Sphagnurus paluster TaxID=117069 RepID=A0A9P7GPM5_9AGAR|nr:hypothetical protein H0H81_011441 [Sphagnurus paluster]